MAFRPLASVLWRAAAPRILGPPVFPQAGAVWCLTAVLFPVRRPRRQRGPAVSLNRKRLSLVAQHPDIALMKFISSSAQVYRAT